MEDVLQKLEHRYRPNESRDLVGIDKGIASLESSLKVVKMIGIWGMGGIGKTTIARAVYDKLSPQYDNSCFLTDVREESAKHGLSSLHRTLFSYKLRVAETSFCMSKLKRKKLLIALDDVSNLDQLEYLIGEYDYLGPDSRVIVTTRDKQILISSAIKRIHEVEGLNFEESVKLFSKNAFNKTHPEIGFEELTKGWLIMPEEFH